MDGGGAPPGSGTPTDPFTTIGAALSNPARGAGDVVLVAPGVYAENVYVGSFTSPFVHLRSSDGPLRTTIRPLTIHVAVRNSIIEGFTLETLGAAVAGTDRLVRCIVCDTGVGVTVQNFATLDRCTVVRNAVGVRGNGLSGTITVRSSIVWGNGDDLQEPGTTDFEWVLDHDALGELPLTWTGGSLLDPQLWDVDRRDFHLRPGSPCIDGGSGSSPTDPDGSAADIGALAYDSTYAPPPNFYCVTVSTAHIGVTGSQSLAANDFQLTVENAPAGLSGLFFDGAGTTQVPFGEGFRCVGAGGVGLFRLSPPQSIGTDGRLSRRLDFGAPPAGSGPGAVEPGSTWNFQFWFRVPLWNSFDDSSAVSVGFIQ